MEEAVGMHFMALEHWHSGAIPSSIGFLPRAYVEISLSRFSKVNVVWSTQHAHLGDTVVFKTMVCMVKAVSSSAVIV